MDPRDDQAFTDLEIRYRTERQSAALIELYLGRLEVLDGPRERTALLRKVARVFDEELDDRPGAFDALIMAFELDSSELDTVRYLERMAQATNRWPELVHTVNGWLEAEKDSLRTTTLCLHMAKWYAEDLGRPEYAQPYYQKALTISPPLVVLRHMANHHKKIGQWQQQGQILTQALELAVEDTDRKEILTELGEVLEKNAGGVEQSISFYRRALEVDAYHLAALDALDRIYTDRGLLHELVDIHARKAKARQR
jgi:golgin subfamily B member 1